MTITVVAGAGGFIGGHLTRRLLGLGRRVRAVDVKPLAEWFQRHPGAEDVVLDLAGKTECEQALEGADEVFNLACDMGGMGFIETHRAQCMLSVLINTHLLLAARKWKVGRYFFASSACIYPVHLQQRPGDPRLAEDCAYPAMPEPGYGWEKLFSEQMCARFREDFGVETRVARYHNVYGPHGSFRGGREKAPAALSRKVAEAVISGRHEIEIWGDGTQTRSFMHIDDCVEGTLRLMASDEVDPMNIGSEEVISVNGLVSLLEELAGVKLERRYGPGALGVMGRSSDNTRVRARLGWEPRISLREGLPSTYRWVFDEVRKAGTAGEAACL